LAGVCEYDFCQPKQIMTSTGPTWSSLLLGDVNTVSAALGKSRLPPDRQANTSTGQHKEDVCRLDMTIISACLCEHHVQWPKQIMTSAGSMWALILPINAKRMSVG
jgi:hypothetical protein